MLRCCSADVVLKLQSSSELWALAYERCMEKESGGGDLCLDE